MKALYYFLLAVALLFVPNCLKAVSSGDLMGQVIDIETHKPVPYARVIFENYFDKVTVTANEHGLYYCDHIPEGRYQMRVEFNCRIFIIKRVKVYDSYASEVNFFVSSSENLPDVVGESRPDQVIKPLEPHDIVLTSTDMGRATMSLSDVLMGQPGVDIFNGRLYVKGAPVKIFIDGTQVMAPGVFNK